MTIRLQDFNQPLRTLMSAILVCQALVFAGEVFAAETYPKEDWVDDYDPIASPDAIVGGKVNIALGPFPSSLNAITNYTYQSIVVFGHLFDPLMSQDPITMEWRPHIADKIEVSDDQLTFTVYMNPNARWNDGKQITAADFKFTLDTIMDPKNIVGPFRSAYNGFSDFEQLGDFKFKISADELHWRNLNAIAGFIVLPKHYFEGKDFNKANFEFPVVSGQYEIKDIKEGVSIEFERRTDWWLQDQKRFQGINNFEIIEYRFFPEREMIFEAFKKGEVDLFGMATSTIWNQGTKGEAFDKNWIIKQKVYNLEPMPYQGYALNLRREPYNDRRVRLALAHLLDRRRVNETMRYGEYFLLRSHVTRLYDEENPNPNPIYEFDIEKARSLLAEAGWKVNPATGKLEKDGKPFVINFLLRAPEWSKYLVVYQEDLKKVGIDMNIQLTDWAGWSKEMDEFNFEMTLAAWGVPVNWDPEGSWHSDQANEKGGNNISGLQVPEVDALIEEQKKVFDVQKRNDILRKIDQLVYAEVPMILELMIDFKRLLYWNKFGTPDTVLDKYQDVEAAYSYWWIDPDLEAELEAAMDSGEALPPRPSEVYFTEEFSAN